MIEIRFDIEGTERKMVVTKNLSGKLISVKDDLGKEAYTTEVNELTIANEVKDENGKPVPQGEKNRKEKFRSPMVDARNDTFIITRHNPTCGWYYYNRQWYYLCY